VLVSDLKAWRPAPARWEARSFMTSTARRDPAASVDRGGGAEAQTPRRWRVKEDEQPAHRDSRRSSGSQGEERHRDNRRSGGSQGEESDQQAVGGRPTSRAHAPQRARQRVGSA
jgi:hypothetical protein